MLEEIVNPDRVNSAEIVIGIPSLNEADSILLPVTMAAEGLIEYFPQKSSVIINVDNHSTDGTKDVFLSAETEVPKIYVSSPEGVRGKGVNVRNLLEVAVELGADFIIMLDADLKSITPMWIETFLEPLVDGYDFVVPIYARHKYDGTITNNVAYPLLRMLYGVRVRQPISGDFGISGKLARCMLMEKTWYESVFNFGIDIWMTTIAICRNFNVCQTFMGSTKTHRHKDPVGLGMMFSQVVGTIFQLMGDFEFIWKGVFTSRPSTIFGFGLGQREDFEEVEVNKKGLYESFKNGFDQHMDIWEAALTPGNLQEIITIKGQTLDDIFFPEHLWARIVIDFSIAYRSMHIDRDKLLDSLIPLYHCSVLSFINKTPDKDTQDTERYLEEFCRNFEGEKNYLIDQWDKSIRGSGMGRAAELLRG